MAPHIYFTNIFDIYYKLYFFEIVCYFFSADIIKSVHPVFIGSNNPVYIGCYSFVN